MTDRLRLDGQAAFVTGGGGGIGRAIAIRLAEANDFSRLEFQVPCLRRIFFNGQTSGRFETIFREHGYDTRVLPSTSPAYTLAFAEKVNRWRAAGIGGDATR